MKDEIQTNQSIVGKLLETRKKIGQKLFEQFERADW